MDKIRKAVFTLAKNKAPGPDGFLILFYQEFWDIINEDLVNIFKSLSSSTDLSRLNYTHMILVPKKAENPVVSDYRPISLKNGIIKIIFIVLSIRLVMDLLVRSSQTAFIKGRSIFKSYATASDIINYFIKAKIPRILLKINFEKVFDLVS